ncbi:MAG: hypothetical protein HYZ43_11555 [Flavobacteriia bacterium]|nr:hypothetical protein [Flavobacteriia bacterium]
MKFSLILFVSLLLVSCLVQSAETDLTSDIVLNETYPELIALVKKKQTEIKAAYLKADSTERDSIIVVAQDYLLKTITTDFFNHWYGTEWDFNGTTRTPREGKIACGYFITTVLSDAGFKIPRVYWAQQASEYYIKRMTSDIKRYSNVSIEKVMTYFQGREDGLYVVGLDSHVGFVYKRGKKLQFVHASYYNPKEGVKSENLDSKNPLSQSEYRVIGRILDKEMVRKWILEEEWGK